MKRRKELECTDAHSMLIQQTQNEDWLKIAAADGEETRGGEKMKGEKRRTRKSDTANTAFGIVH